MPLSPQRFQRRQKSRRDSTSSTLDETPIVLKGGHSFNVVSQWFFLWVIPLLRRTRSDPDFDSESIQLQEEESAQYAGERLGERWQQEELDHKEK